MPIPGLSSAAAKKAAEAKAVTDAKPRMPLFVAKKFTSSAGLELDWKVECDGLPDADWEWAGAEVARRFSFQAVHGVPKGKPTGKDNGAAFANACRKHVDTSGDYFLIVDDVLTTGGSMERARDATKNVLPHLPRIGVVLFARQVPPQWIDAIWKFWG